MEESHETVAGQLPRRGWYIAMAASRLGSSPRPARVLDQHLVLFRDSRGIAHALIDRCCHRGVELSLGKVEGDSIACRYHGWRYDGAGTCVHIPSLTAGRDVPVGCNIRGYACIEQDSYLWVWPDASPPEPAEPPRLPPLEGRAWIQGVLDLKCSAGSAIENNVDWCHPVFAHPFTHGQFFINQAMGFRDQQYEVRVTENGLVAFSPATANAHDSVPDSGVRLTFELPDRVTVAFAGAFAMTILMHFVPTGPDSCRQEWLTTLPPGASAPPGIAWSDDKPEIFEQDRLVLESAQRWHDRDPSLAERSVEADVSTLLVRQIIGLAASGHWPHHRDRLPSRRIVNVRA